MKFFRRILKKGKSLDHICCSETEFRKRLKIERSRTHRNAHEFSLVTFNLKSLGLKKNQVNQMIKTIHSRIRDIDTLGWYDKNHVGIILPYTTSQGARKFSNSIIEAMNEYKEESKFALVTYPPEKSLKDQETKKKALRSM